MVSLPGRSPRKRLLRGKGGFTLIELMIAVAVVAILAAIAYPSYQEQVRKSRRAQAKADLVELTQMAERYRTVNNTYATFDLATMAFAQSPRTGTAYYGVALSNNTATTFTLTATPNANGGQNNDKCGTLTINQAGAKGNSAGTYAQCW
ncbi:type IV pilin protein [Pseudoxanthomonas sp.]|uniref:type IV pilin protein n=1 Tax=Pseudoxanthomonas sp. TaxID=1871049 RepID=UPI0026331DFB|nr:type IV pilin protein [Pseudoxanthomonas sp.]WDS38209.1 MAG: type IV pilin protein [Pseudoxanthomonas sp.]